VPLCVRKYTTKHHKDGNAKLLGCVRTEILNSSVLNLQKTFRQRLYLTHGAAASDGLITTTISYQEGFKHPI